tara:strand:- start:2220 stop:3830 length:1611 start_codon:yes stop_codon:yes gene_type:complete
MAKFLNKKEQVIHFQLTPYGKYLFSAGTFKPVYYAFFDSEILYDGAYAGLTESQHEIHDRIKKNTAYLESIVSFRELETSPPFESKYDESSDVRAFSFDVVGSMAAKLDRIRSLDYIAFNPSVLPGTGLSQTDSLHKYLHQIPRADEFKFESSIGDARFNGNTQQNAPAWKVVTLQGMISSSAQEDISFIYENSYGRNEQKIPQVNITLNYKKRVVDPSANVNPQTSLDLAKTTQRFSDGKVIELVSDDLVVYADEINTELLNENFDIEAYKVDIVPGNLASGFVFFQAAATNGDTITISDGNQTNTYEFQASHTDVTLGNVWVIPGFAPSVSEGNFVSIFQNKMQFRDGSWPLILGVSVDSYAWWRYNKYLNIEITDHIYIDEATETTEYKRELKSNVESVKANDGYITTTAAAARITVGSITGSTNPLQTLTRKNFNKNAPQIIDGYMVSPQQIENTAVTLTTSSVEYYFDIHADRNVNHASACRGAEIFNKESFYIDLDFDCDISAMGSCSDLDVEFYDIYGKVVEDPEICQT